MSWIKEIPYEQAVGSLKKLYKRVKGPDDNIDNILMAHSLRPHTLQGHMSLYKNVLHHKDNELPKWYLETLGVYVSLLNLCDYCVDHHYAGLQRLLGEQEAARIRAGLEQADIPKDLLLPSYVLGLIYARQLTQLKEPLIEQDVQVLREAGLDDGQILEINQVVSYFNYANRTVIGLGVTTAGDILGLSPNDNADESNWQHQ
ncbi:MAG: hypothetical protein KTR30_01175 [Saprospiraceae bacterium]|nr:hypothetical protein [Saprospiraceae bacterium]